MGKRQPEDLHQSGLITRFGASLQFRPWYSHCFPVAVELKTLLNRLLELVVVFYQDHKWGEE